MVLVWVSIGARDDRICEKNRNFATIRKKEFLGANCLASRGSQDGSATIGCKSFNKMTLSQK